MNTHDRLQKVFREIFNNTDSDVDLDMSNEGISSIYGLDSIKHVELILTIESEFDINFSLDELQSMKTIREILNTIEGHLSVSK